MIAGIIAREGIKGFIPYGAGYVAGGALAAFQAAKGIYNLTKKKQTDSMAQRKVAKAKASKYKRKYKRAKKALGASGRKSSGKRVATKRSKSYARQVPFGASTSHSGTSSTLCIVHVPGKKKVKKIGAWNYRAQYQCMTGGTGATQNVGEVQHAKVFALLTKDTLTTTQTYQPALGGTLEGADNKETCRSLFSLNPYQNISGSADSSGTAWWVGGSRPNNDKIYIHSASVLIDLVNLTTISNNVQVSVFLCKKDTANDPVGQSAVIFANYNVPGIGGSNYFPPTTANLNTAGVSDPQKTDLSLPGSKYGECKDLPKWWKMVCNEQFELAAGATKKIDMVMAINKLIDRQVVTSTDHQYIKDYSICCILRTYGQVVMDSTQEGVTGMKYVTYGPSAVGCVATVKYSISGVRDNVNRIKIDVVQPGISQAAIGNLKQVNMVDTEISVGVV